MAELLIQGIKCQYRDKDIGEAILYENLPQEEQYFRIENSPFTDDELVAIAGREHTNTPTQQYFITREQLRMRRGVYAYINGVLRFIPGSYWGYINYWTLENGKRPDYRETDRQFFIFFEYCRLLPELLGVTRGKGRRQGATSMGAWLLVYEAINSEYRNCGIMSKTGEDAKLVFTSMVMLGFKALQPWIQPDFDSDDDSKTILRFVKPVERKKKGLGALKREGLNSYINYKNTALNSYDSGRLSLFLGDEFGKLPKEIDVNIYWSKVSKTLREGKKKVGFAFMPTTVNSRDKGGGPFKEFWRDANQEGLDKDGNPFGIKTPNKVVRYFVPATEGYAGCIDKFGNSIIEDPETPIMGNDGEWITEGSRTIILRERAMLDGEKLMEHRRDYPLDEYDMFAFETGQCEFNEANIMRQIKYLESNPVYLRRCRLYEDEKGGITFADDTKGDWLLYERPMEENKVVMRSGAYHANNTGQYVIGVDTYKNIFAQAGSLGTICVFKKSCIVNGVETGLYPVAFFAGRPRLIRLFNYEVFKACRWYGCKANFEIDAGTWFYEDFMALDALPLLEWTPALDPIRRKPLIKPGTESANPFQLAKQLEVAKMFYDGTDINGYNGNTHRVVFVDLLKQSLEYSHDERTPYHLVIALMMALLPVLAITKRPIPPQKPRQLLPTYKVKIAA